MEDGWNIFDKQVICNSKTKVEKPPTRLQKHAPESLKLDQMKSAAAADANAARTNPFGTSSTGTSKAAATPIPLLTPLALSPSPFPQMDDEFAFPIPTDHDVKTAAPAPTSTAIFSWNQTVAAGFNVEASAWLALFQNTCVLVNDA